MKTTNIIGKRVTYETGNTVYNGTILDKFRTLSIRNGEQVQMDLYLVESGGNTYKISPMQITKVYE
jgi:hypothetical protein